MKFSYNWLKEFAKFKDSPQALAEFLTLRVFEIESVTKKGADTVLEVKLLPNRVSDAAGHVGLAREIAALKDSRLKIQDSRIVESKTRRASNVLKVKIENPRDCPRYTARVMTNIKVGPPPQWMRERLEVCGIQSICNIVDAANYVMLELGQPLHVFDYDQLKTKARQKQEILNPKSKTIIVRLARKGEKLLALDNKTYPLSSDILVIADEKGPLAVAGIKGGKESGLSAKTRNIVLESANFDRVRTRIASKVLNLKTDASYRFEHGMDPNQTHQAIDRLAEVIQKVAGGEILAGRVDRHSRLLPPAKILLRSDYSNRLIGQTIPPAFYQSAFRRLGWICETKLQRRGQASYLVRPPTSRRDIQIEEDVIEEIARLWGYEKIKPEPPRIPLAPVAPNQDHKWENKIKDILAGAGYTEAYVYHFAGRKLLEIFNDRSDGLLEIENPTNPETKYLNSHPARQFLKIAAENLRHLDSAAIFGIAAGFKPAARPWPEKPAQEPKYLVLTKAVKGDKNKEVFYELKGALDHLFESLGIADHWYDDALTKDERRKTDALHPYRTAKVMADGEFLGIIAELHPKVIERLKVKAKIVFAEIDFDKLWKRARSEAEFKPIGKYPAVIRDLAVIGPENMKADDVEGVIQNSASKLLVDVDLFDYFQDEAMEERGAKSLAFHLIFQSPERTLTDEEVTRLCKKIAAAVKEKGWLVRD